MTLPRSPLPYFVVNAALTAICIAVELPLVWVNGVEGIRFWVAIAWVFGIMVSTFAFVRTSRVVANRSFIWTALWSTLMGLVMPIGWTTVFHTPGAALSYLVFRNPVGPLAMGIVYCVVLSALPKNPRINWVLGVIWSLLFLVDAYLAISLKIYCCDWM